MHLSPEDLKELSPPPPDDPIHNEVSLLRWNVWKLLKESPLAPRPWVESQLDSLFGNYSKAWRIIGFTKAALDQLAGPSRDFTAPRERGVYNRSHLFPRRELIKRLYDMDITTPFSEWCAWTWATDVTVVSLKHENKLLERKDYFLEHAVTFPNPGDLLFLDKNKNWTYGTNERIFLRGLVAGLGI